MTRQKDLKRRIRERMRKTGESYTTARLHILRSYPGDTLAAAAVPRPGMQDASAAPRARMQNASAAPRAGMQNASASAAPVRIRLPRVHVAAVRPAAQVYVVPVFTILLFIIIAMTGCAGDARRSDVAVRDSAGIRIVENLPGSIDAAETWTLSGDPTVEIGGGVDPATPLYHVTDVAPLDDARVAVAMNTPPQVHVFDEDGTLAATLGRRGSGPGEFTSVASIVPLTRDSIAVWDADRRRISIFDANGRFLRELDLSDVAPLSARAAPSSTIASGFTHLLASGPRAFVIFAEGAIEPEAAPGIGRPTLPSARISTTADALADFGAIPGMAMVHGGPAGTLPLPFGARTDAATSGEMLVVGSGEPTQFRVFGDDGTLIRIVRWPDHDRTVRGEWLEEWTAMVEAAQPPIRELVEATPRSERFPAYDGLLTSDEGEVMVGEYAGPTGIWPLRRADEGPEALRPVRRTRERRWLVFDSAGALTATLRTPEGFAPAAARDDRIWGVFTDTLDIESVRAYRIVR